MDGAVPGKIKAGTPYEKPVLIWNLQTVCLPNGHLASYALVSDPETGEFELLNAEEMVSVDWRLVDGAWVPLYDDGEEEGDEPDGDGQGRPDGRDGDAAGS